MNTTTKATNVQGTNVAKSNGTKSANGSLARFNKLAKDVKVIENDITLSFYQTNKDKGNELTFERAFLIQSNNALNIDKALKIISHKIESFACDMAALKAKKPNINLGFKLSKPLFIKAVVNGSTYCDTIKAQSLKIAIRAKSGENMSDASFIYLASSIIVKNMQDKITASQITDKAPLAIAANV